MYSRHLLQIRCIRLFNSSSTRLGRSRPCKWIREIKKESARKSIEANPDVLRVAIDCGINQYYPMKDKALTSMVKQICNGYGYNIHSPLPCRLHLVGVAPGDEVETTLREKFPGYSKAGNLLVSL